MGKTLYHLANGKINVEEVDCTFVPVVGGVGTQLQSDEGYHSNEIANAFAKKFHGSAVQFFRSGQCIRIYTDRWRVFEGTSCAGGNGFV